MSDSQQVPGPAIDNNERILSRPADDFARLPAAEVEPVSQPGAGPHGSLDDGLRMPTVLIVAGMAVAFATFLVGTPILLVVGFVLVVIGGIWSLATSHSGSGTGPARRRRG